MDAQTNHGGRRRRRRKNPQTPKVAPEPIIVAARRPDSPRLEKPTRRMKAASARPKARGLVQSSIPAPLELKPEPKKRREARIVQRKEDEIDDREKNRRRLLGRLMAAEGRAQISQAANAYLAEGFELPRQQDAQLKMLEHFDETRAREAIRALAELFDQEEPQQLPVIRQRLRRLEDHADEAETRDAAAALRRILPA